MKSEHAGVDRKLPARCHRKAEEAVGAAWVAVDSGIDPEDGSSIIGMQVAVIERIREEVCDA